jgi:hypothetical protein
VLFYLNFSILCYLAIFFPALITQLIPNGVYVSSWMVTSRPPGCKIASESEPQDAVKHVIFTLHGCPSHRTYLLLDLTWDSYMPIGQICYQIQVLTKITLLGIWWWHPFLPFWSLWMILLMVPCSFMPCDTNLYSWIACPCYCLDLIYIYIYILINW